MAQLQPYEQYQPIDYDYVKQLPTGWQLWKIAHAFNLIGSGTTPESGNEKFYINGSINWINTGDLNDGVLESCKNKITKEAFKKHSVLKIYPKGTLLIAMYGATIGKVAVTNIECCTNQACCALSKSKILTNKFTLYWFIANRKNIVNLSYGGGQPNISQDVIKKLKIPVPPLDTQNRIVEYLDKKNNEIDRFIRNKERLIALLGEEKKKKLFDAVTKGIDVKVSFKLSKIKWLPEIPVKWDEKKLKFTVKKISGGITPSMDNISFWNGDIPWVTSKDMKSEIISDAEMKITKKALQQTAIKMIPNDSILLVVRSGILQHSLPACLNSVPITINQDLKAIVVNKNIYLPHYFRMLLKGIELNILQECRKAVATVESIEMSDFTNFLLPIPLIDEQNEIIGYINRTYEIINSAISKAQQEITSIKEYREALITDLVTGKRCLPPSIPK